jgi:uncharacterized protein (DUF1697 family)
MTSYVALLRGVNVGGNNMLKMAELKACLESAGFANVRTYIQSGNVLFESDIEDERSLDVLVQKAIAKTFKMQLGVVVFSKLEWQQIIKHAPKDWGHDKTWKHNLLVMLHPYTMHTTVAAIGELKPGIESLHAGNGVLYQSVSIENFGRATTGKLASNPAYKQMTVRNFNTATKLVSLL